MKKVFFSWQSDIPEYKRFLVKCIEAAIADLDDWELDMAERNPTGADDIPAEIIRKIKESSLVIGDVSLVGEYVPYGSQENGTVEPRKTINPNVAYEVGYALDELGKERLVLLASKETTPRTNDLPFDVSHRRTLLKSFDQSNLKSLATELRDIIMAPKPPLRVDKPYIYIEYIGGWSKENGQMTFTMHNDDNESYLLESIEMDGQIKKAGRSLKGNESVQFVLVGGLPVPPLEHRIETISFIVSRSQDRFKITQKLYMGNRADKQYNLDGVEPAPDLIERLK